MGGQGIMGYIGIREHTHGPLWDREMEFCKVGFG